MPNQYLLARDTINGAEGSVVVTRNGLNYVVAGMNNITANGEIQNQDMRVIGTNAIQDKPNGVKQTATGNIYYGDDIFREMLYNYITTGVMEEFDIQLTNSDPTVTVGRQTVVLYGCPGEEGGAAKAFMARDRIWKELDAALTWHPGSVNQVTSGTCNTCIQTEYKFTGIASHASGSPELGRSALDAVELMNVGVQFLREHMPQSARIHYAITDAGGNSPNVVQPHAQVLYMVRSVLAKDALALQERVDKIAQGAAMMTETKLSKRFIDGCSNTVPNKTLETLFWKNFNEVGVPTHTPEEVEYAKQIVASYEMTKNKLPGDACDEDAEIAEWVDKASEHGTVPLNDFLVPYHFSTKERPGSTDVGDVSWLVPTAQINVVTFPSNSPGHSWQNVSCGHTSIGHKGLLTAGKVIAATAIDLYENPQIIADAKAEFDKRAAGGYYCPVPEDAVPTVVGGQF